MDFGNASQWELVQIRDIIVSDQVALQRWTRIIDHVAANSPQDVLRLKGLADRHDYGEAVLQTLQLCKELGGRVDLIQVFQGHGLNSLADKLTTRFERHGGGKSATLGCTPGFWFDVGDLPPNFVGRESELLFIHKVLTKRHSHESVAANIVSITGPAGVGKSTLARKYAFLNWTFYEGNVIWINAESVESTRDSFSRALEEYREYHGGLRLATTTDSGKLIRTICSLFANKKCLLIFDNLQDDEALDQYKPVILGPGSSTPYVLITSRHINVAPLRRHQLLLVDRQREKEQPNITTQVTVSVPTLQWWKLALSTNSQSPRWIAMLKEVKNVDESAFLVAAVLSCLNPQNITIDFLAEILQNLSQPLTKEEVRNILNLLDSLSLIEVIEERAAIVIDPLLQKMVRWCFTKESEETILRAIAMSFHRVIFTEGIFNKVKIQEFSAHTAHLLTQQVKYPTVMLDFDTYQYVLGICDYLFKQGLFVECASISQEAASAYQKVNGHEFGIHFYFVAADAQYNTGNYEEALKLSTASIEFYQTENMSWVWGNQYKAKAMNARIYSAMGGQHHAKSIETYNDLIHTKKDDLNLVLCYQFGKAIALINLGHIDPGSELIMDVYEKAARSKGIQAWRASMTAWRLDLSAHCKKVQLKVRESEVFSNLYEKSLLKHGESHPLTAAFKVDVETLAATTS